MAHFEPNPAYELCKGDTFRYAGQQFEAVSDPSGEFNTYITVKDESGKTTEIYIRDGSDVEILKED